MCRTWSPYSTPLVAILNAQVFSVLRSCPGAPAITSTRRCEVITARSVSKSYQTRDRRSGRDTQARVEATQHLSAAVPLIHPLETDLDALES